MTTAVQAQQARFRHALGHRISRGGMLLLPLLLTFWLVQFAFDTIDGLLQPIIANAFGEEIPGLSFGIIVAAMFLVGAFASARLLQYPAALFERGVQGLPVVGSIYGTTRQLFATAKDGGKRATGFSTVVRVEYPRRGAWAVGFLTAVVTDDEGNRYGVVYMPSTPMPQSGWLMQLPLEEIELLNWSSGNAMQYIVSAGVTSPSEMAITPSDKSPWAQVAEGEGVPEVGESTTP